MTGAVIERKSAGVCLRCPRPASETSVLCEQHAADLAARVRKSTTKLRADRRARGLCAACGQPSRSYRCGNCKPRQPQLPLEATHG